METIVNEKPVEPPMSGVEAFGYIAAALLLFAVDMCVGGAVRAYVTMLLWRWFVVPLGPAPLLLWHAYGLLLVVKAATFQWPDQRIEDRRSQSEKLTAAVVRTIAGPFVWLVVLAVGAFVASMMPVSP